jgi:two-component system, NarL family, sensor kinase
MSEAESPIIPLIFAGIFLAVLMSTFIIAMVVLHRQRQVQNRQKLDQIKIEHEKMLLGIENEIQQETLTQVGRELHDNIGQLLSLAKLNFGSIKPEKHIAGRELLSQIIQEVRSLSKTLNLDWVESITLEEFLKQQLDKIKSTGFCETQLLVEAPIENLKKDEKLVLIRVIQEILNNAIKHASPDRIVIRTLNSGAKPLIIIEDNGKGFDTKLRSNGSGMTNLSKRMTTIGGEFYIESELGKGTLIKMTLPK